MTFAIPPRHHLRFAAEAALFAWLAVIVNDWHESSCTRPKGHMYAVVLIGSIPCLMLGLVLAARARQQLVDDVRARRDKDGELPTPLWVLGAGIKRGLVAALLNVIGYLGFLCSHPFRIASSFLLAGVIGGAWLARSIIVREYPEPVARPYASLLAVVPGALLATIVTSTTLVTARMSLDNAILWAFDPVPFCGGVETANASVALLGSITLLTAGLALAVVVARRSSARVVLAALILAIGCVAFAELSEKVLLASPPHACRNTPYSSPLVAMVQLRSSAFMHRVLWVSGALGGAVAAVFLLVASRRVASTEKPVSELGPYRSPPSSRRSQ